MTNKEQQIINLFYYWTGRFGIKYLSIKRDNRINCYAEVDGYQRVMIKYNNKKMSKCPYHYVLLVVFHEIGHIISKLPYETDDQQIRAENRAETWALKQLKKYYPKEYKEQVRFITRTKALETYKICGDYLYFLAFRTIPEYYKGAECIKT